MLQPTIYRPSRPIHPAPRIDQRLAAPVPRAMPVELRPADVALGSEVPAPAPDVDPADTMLTWQLPAGTGAPTVGSWS